MMRFNAMLAAAAIAVIAAPPATASVREDGQRAAAHYVRARAADAAGMLDVAAAGYAAALAAAPEDQVVALRTYRQAMIAGDRALARRAANVLEGKGTLPTDGRLFLLGEAVLAKDWAGASRQADRVEQDDIYGFLVPSIRGWIALGMGEKDPVARLADVRKGGALAIAYAGEQRALLLLATGQHKEAIAAIQALSVTAGNRPTRLRLAAAATLVKAGERAQALSLLAGRDGPFAAARALIEAGRPLPGAIDDSATGIGELIIRVAIDISRERATPLSLNLARLATFLAPDNSETWIVTAELLASAANTDAALAALAKVPADDPGAETVRLARLQLLVRKGERKEALVEAQRSAALPGASLADLTRVGDLLGELDRPAEAAEAYSQALALAEKEPSLADSRWTVLMLRGGAYDAAGDWASARADLQQAVKLAPDQAVVLNYLGYAQLERRENLDEAEKLIERASILKPDDASITDSLGWTYYLRGDLPKAIVTLERAVAGEPAEPTINEHLGDAYWTAGRRYEARYAWRAALIYAEDKIADRIRGKIESGLPAANATATP